MLLQYVYFINNRLADSSRTAPHRMSAGEGNRVSRREDRPLSSSSNIARLGRSGKLRPLVLGVWKSGPNSCYRGVPD